MNRESNFYITPHMLRKHGACLYTVERLKETFGVGHYDRVFLTEANVRLLLASDHYFRLSWPGSLIRRNMAVRDNARIAELYGELNRIINGFAFDTEGNLYFERVSSPTIRARSAAKVYDILVEMASILYQARLRARRNREDNYDLAA